MRKVKDKSTIEGLFRMVTDKRLEHLGRLLKWLVIYNKYHDPAEYLGAKNNAGISGIEFPDISDILEGK